MTFVKNKKAYFDYSIEDTFEAGIILEGWEVKSIRYGMADIKQAFVKIVENGAYISGMHVSRWKTQSASIPINENRERKLLLNSKEIDELAGLRKSSGVSIIVLELFEKNNKIKVKIGVGRGRKKYDKRQKIKEREMKKEIFAKGKRW
ncbi:SsrA-binding protein SmpB [Candidatus Dojkabacteria bacterium]|nr:SsrA-binding protein SmpB [Candidatus Dojkabacteria bacterium]